MYPSTLLRERLSRRLPEAPAAADLDVPGTSPAAVLVPVIADGEHPRLVFTERTMSLSRHAGEISFPGGLPEDGEDLADAALREAQEEVGIDPAGVSLAGTLPPVPTHVSGLLIVPFVGVLEAEPSFVPNEAEIAQVFAVPVRTLASVGEEREFERDGRRFTTFVFEVDDHVIWGATGRILRSFLDALDEPGAS
ncbi:MAG TPA: CoA pyrophosphatase [Actinomycetota bacterium]|jgi:8-oxo-dGTP pyrophosphatase MutT (NUDIX family)